MRQEELRRLSANAVAPNSSAELLAKAVAELKRRLWRRPTLKGDPAGEGKLHGRPHWLYLRSAAQRQGPR